MEENINTLKVDEFIEECNVGELVYLWEMVNTKEFIGMISDELKNQVEKEMQELFPNT